MDKVSDKTHDKNQRAQHVLHCLIERYIKDGQPVGSKVLADESSLMLSSASIRSIMQELEAGGYLIAPHTSAGRVPTSRGYRLFVDQLLTIHRPAERALKKLKARFTQGATDDRSTYTMINRATDLIAGVTSLVGMVSLPKRSEMILRHIEFLPLTEKRVLIILVVNAEEVQNRVITTEREYTSAELERLANYLTNKYHGKDLLKIRDLLREELRRDQHDLEKMLKVVMQVIEGHKDETDDVVVTGERHLFDCVEAHNYHRLRELFEVFEDKRAIFHLLDRCLNVESMQLFIGEESGHNALKNYSVVTAPYSVDNKVIGVLGVIGPMRMPYKQVISAVDATAKILSQALSNEI